MICYQKRNMTFQIEPSEHSRKIHLQITCDKKGLLPIFFGYKLTSFLKKNFFQIHATRLQYVLSQEKEVTVSTNIKRKGYQYFLSELISFLLLLLGIFCYNLSALLAAKICFFIGICIVANSLWFSLFKIFDYISNSPGKYKQSDSLLFTSKFGLGSIPFSFLLVCLKEMI